MRKRPEKASEGRQLENQVTGSKKKIVGSSTTLNFFVVSSPSRLVAAILKWRPGQKYGVFINDQERTILSSNWEERSQKVMSIEMLTKITK